MEIMALLFYLSIALFTVGIMVWTIRNLEKHSSFAFAYTFYNCLDLMHIA